MTSRGAKAASGAILCGEPLPQPRAGRCQEEHGFGSDVLSHPEGAALGSLSGSRPPPATAGSLLKRSLSDTPPWLLHRPLRMFL